MICSYIFNNDYGFIELHAEQVYSFIAEQALISCDSGTNDFKNSTEQFLQPAISTTKLTVSPLQKLIDFCKRQNSLPKYFVLDFEGVSFITKNLKQYFKDLESILNEKKSQLVFLNFYIDLTQNDKDENYEYLEKLLEKDSSRLTDQKIRNSIKRDLLEKKKEDMLIRNFETKTPPLHESSSVYLTKYFNFKNFIYEDPFVYYCLYSLAKKMISKNEYHNWEIVPNKKMVLFCQTLNGAYIGSILSDLLDIDIFLIDHLGPINKIYSNRLYGTINKNNNYLVVSDVLCLGTEVKSAKSIIEFSGANYIGNVAFLRIESRKNEDIDFKDIEFYYRISSEYNPIDYKILTGLDKSLNELLN